LETQSTIAASNYRGLHIISAQCSSGIGPAHPSQNFAVSRFSARHFAHCIRLASQLL
jgi:hypothetical protein